MRAARRGDPAPDGERTILFVDEIHRFNKAQQDAFLPDVEDGDVVLIGATTENPSFAVNTPLLSRSRCSSFEPLRRAVIASARALADAERGLGAPGRRRRRRAAQRPDRQRRCAGGAARSRQRRFRAGRTTGATSTPRGSKARSSGAPAPRPAGDEHYDVVSALIKSLRGSDPDAAVYWLARMLEAGEDPLFIARRMVIFAAEDVGIADPQALRRVAAHAAASSSACPKATPDDPGGDLPRVAPKSNAVYVAYGRAAEDASAAAPPVPNHLRNAPTGLMREMGYGEGYRYAHDEPDAVADMDCLPPSLEGPHVLRADGARVREGDQAAARGMEGTETAAPRGVKLTIAD